MIRAIVDVLRGEGVASAVRRASEYLHGNEFNARSAPILNVCFAGIAPRLGGVQIQLVTRLREEAKLRAVRLVQRGDLAGARAVHLEGTHDVPVDAILRLRVPVVVSVHDFTLMEIARGRELLSAARGVIFPSRFLRDAYGVDGEIIEPGVEGKVKGGGSALAFAGNVRHHKGAHLLPSLIDAGGEWHIFGGGDPDLLRAIRRLPNATVHGYYRHGQLPSLLAKHRVGLVVLPSIVPESFGLVLSEAWLGGAAVAAFDRGAYAERIRAHGGGWVGNDLAEIVRQWRAGAITTTVPTAIPTPLDAARAHIDCYRRWGLL